MQQGAILRIIGLAPTSTATAVPPTAPGGTSPEDFTSAVYVYSGDGRMAKSVADGVTYFFCKFTERSLHYLNAIDAGVFGGFSYTPKRWTIFDINFPWEDRE